MLDGQDAFEVLRHILPTLLLTFGVFARLSAFLMLAPVIGEVSVSVRTRLSVAFFITILIAPIAITQSNFKLLQTSDFVELIVLESLVGLLFGLTLRLMIYLLQILGNIVSQGLSISQVLGEGIATEPNTTISTLAMLSGVTLLVTYDFHIYILQVFYNSYATFPIGEPVSMYTVSQALSEQALAVFRLSFSFAFPFILLNFLYNLILGFLNRAMPQLMVSFVGMPFITGVGLALLSLGFGSILMLWWQSFNELTLAMAVW